MPEPKTERGNLKVKRPTCRSLRSLQKLGKQKARMDPRTMSLAALAERGARQDSGGIPRRLK
jgi:hypothetical protein